MRNKERRVFPKSLEIKKNMIEKIIELTKENLDMGDKDITAETSFKEDLGVDSLDLFELVMAFEDEFGLEIPSEDLNDLLTIQDVADYLAAHGIDD